LQALARSTGAAINRGQEDGNSTRLRRIWQGQLFLPQKRRRNEDHGSSRSGEIPCRETTLISGARCRFQLELLDAVKPPPGRLVLSPISLLIFFARRLPFLRSHL